MVSIFLKKIIFWFPWCNTRENLSIDVSITGRTDIDEAMVVSALWHKSKFNLDLFLKIKSNFGFPCCSTREDLSIDVSITSRTDIDEARVISFVGVRTDGVRTGTFQNRHMETGLHTKKNLVKSSKLTDGVRKDRQTDTISE